jgi:hypothetical protein
LVPWYWELKRGSGSERERVQKTDGAISSSRQEIKQQARNQAAEITHADRSTQNTKEIQVQRLYLSPVTGK